MITILVAKNFTGNPADGIDNVNLAVFGRLKPEDVRFLVDAPDGFSGKGSIEKSGLKSQNRTPRFFEKIRLLRKIKPDYLWGNGGLFDILFLIFKPACTRYCIDWHTVLERKSNSWRVRTPWRLRKFIFNRADLVIAVSEFSAQSVRRYFPNKKVISILNGVDLELFNPDKKDERYLKDKYGIDFPKPIVVFIGTLEPRKRPDIFIELAKRCPMANFVAVGRRVPPHDFLAAAAGLKNFKWIEKMPREDVARLLASSAMFVFPSLNDASAAVILEAMASGCVPIVSRSGGNQEFLKDGESGLVIDLDDGEVEEFAVKIGKILSDEKLRRQMSEASRREAELNSWDAAAESYFNVLKKEL